MAKIDKDDPPKAIDIAKGKSTPDETSRPIIVKNKGLMSDPMVKAEDGANETSKDDTVEPKETTPAASKKTIQPVSEPDNNPSTGGGEDKTSSSSDDTTGLNKTDTKPTDAPPPEDEAAKKQQDAIVGAVVDQADKSSDVPAEAPDEEEQRRQAINKLVDEKTYFLPIGQITRRKQNKQAAFILVLLLVLAGAYIAADMGLINLPFDLPFHFISH